MRVPDLEEVWLALEGNPKATKLAEFGTGLVFHGKNLPPGCFASVESGRTLRLG
jgi:hypothetical protein